MGAGVHITARVCEFSSLLLWIQRVTLMSRFSRQGFYLLSPHSPPLLKTQWVA